VNAPTVNEFVYHKLKEDILWGGFAPNDRLRFDELRDRYGVSFSSLREALSRLAGDGLVEIESHKGARVAGVNTADFKDLVAVRQIVEVNCLKRAIELGDDRWEADALAAFHMYESYLRSVRASEPGALRTRVERHNSFHTSLMSACDSPRLLNLRVVLATQAERYLTLAYRTVPANVDEMLRDHETLLRAAIERRSSLACAILHDHIGSASERLLMKLAEAEQGTGAKVAAVR
jgi:DNA-binding GntR family transcriptional regulator